MMAQQPIPEPPAAPTTEPRGEGTPAGEEHEDPDRETLEIEERLRFLGYID